MITLTLVYGRSSLQREEAIASRLNKSLKNVVIAEGLAHGSTALAKLTEQDSIALIRIAPGCLCCIGNLTMQVTLNRVLRQGPQAIYLSLSSSEHLSGIREFLQNDQYRNLLCLTEDINSELPV